MDTGRSDVLAWEERWIRRGRRRRARRLAARCCSASSSLQSSIGGGANFEGLRRSPRQQLLDLALRVCQAIGFILLVGAAALPLQSGRGAQPAGPQPAGRPGDRRRRSCSASPALLLAAGTQRRRQRPSSPAKRRSRLSVKEATAKECARRTARKTAPSTFAEDFDKRPRRAKATPPCAGEEARRRRRPRTRSTTPRPASTAGAFAGLAGGLGLVIALFYTRPLGDADRPAEPLLGLAGHGGRRRRAARPHPAHAALVHLPRPAAASASLPGGRPPAWAAGEAIPWPTPGEKAAADLEGGSAGAEGLRTGIPQLPEERRRPSPAARVRGLGRAAAQAQAARLRLAERVEARRRLGAGALGWPGRACAGCGSRS